MRDLWGFLLQTLTVSGAAVLVLVVKTLLCRQLSPRWQAGIWGLVGIVALLPAGWGGRYVLVNWPAAVETLKAVLAGDYGPLGVIAPIPLPNAAPQTVWPNTACPPVRQWRWKGSLPHLFAGWYARFWRYLRDAQWMKR